MVELIVLGLDGLDSGLVKKELVSGGMPKSMSLYNEGKLDFRAIDSYKLSNWTYPWTGNAWPTIYCGEDEEYHGVDVPGWQEGAVDFTNVPDTVFDDISHADMKVGVFRMAITFPARPVNGWMLSGFPGGGKEEVRDTETYGITPDDVPEQYLKVKDKKVSSDTDSEVAIVNAEGGKLDVFDQVVQNSPVDEDVIFYGTQMTDKAAHRFHLTKNGRGEGEHDYWESRVGTMTCNKSDDIIKHMIDTYDPDRLIAISDHGMMRFEDNHSMRSMVLEYSKDGDVGLDSIDSILDFRDLVLDRLGIERCDRKIDEIDVDISEEEQEEIEERLEDMGYI